MKRLFLGGYLMATVMAVACEQVTSTASPGSNTPASASSSGGASTSVDAAVAASGDLPPEAPLADADLKRTWVRIAAPHANDGAAVTRTPEGFVALANETTPTGTKTPGPSYDHVYRSADGVTWQRLSSIPRAPNQMRPGFGPLVYGAGRCAVTDGLQFLTSTDLVKWSTAASTSDVDAGYDPIRGLVRLDGTFFGFGVSYVWRSTDGVAWNADRVPLIQGSAIAHGNGVWVIAGGISLRRSTDGVTWEDRSPSCSTPGAACVSVPGGGSTIPGAYYNAVFLDGRFYVDHLSSTDGITWQGHEAPVANEALGGYLFNTTGDTTTNRSDALRAWRPGEAVQTLTVEAPATPAELGNGTGPATVTEPLAGGETCGDHRCVVLGHALYLLR